MTPVHAPRCATRHDAVTNGPGSKSPILMRWRDNAACLDVGVSPELFFPIGKTHPAMVQIEQAKLICGRCEVARTCLQWAMETRQDEGVWGGLSADERRALKRRKARARHAG